MRRTFLLLVLGLLTFCVATPSHVSATETTSSRSISYLVTTGSEYGIWAMDTSSGETHRIVETPPCDWCNFGNTSVLEYEWSADGRFLAFASAPEAIRSNDFRYQLNIFDLLTGDDRIVAPSLDKRGYDELLFSPDGSRLFFISGNDGNDETLQRIYSISVDGTDLKTVATSDKFEFGSIHFAPSGDRIAFRRTRPQGSAWFRPKAWTSKPDGSHRQQVVVSRDGKGYARPLGYSPNGKWLAVEYDRDGFCCDDRIRMYGVATKNYRKTPVRGRPPYWDLDSNRFAFWSGGGYSIYDLKSRESSLFFRTGSVGPISEDWALHVYSKYLDGTKQWDIYLRDIATGARTRLTSTPDVDEGGLAWIPTSATP
jgi:dipeptidyl aminopeptidase/acylaminoacyl peptidase